MDQRATAAVAEWYRWLLHSLPRGPWWWWPVDCAVPLLPVTVVGGERCSGAVAGAPAGG